MAAQRAERLVLVPAARRPGCVVLQVAARHDPAPALGHEAPDGLHYVYGVLPLVVSLLAEAVRAGAAERELSGLDFDALPDDRQRSFALAIVRRETGIMAVSALVVFGLALRAAGTSGKLVLSAA